jgi:chromosome segregation ATPase
MPASGRSAVKASFWLVAALLVVALVGAGIVTLRQRIVISDLEKRLSDRTAQNEQLSARLNQLVPGTGQAPPSRPSTGSPSASSALEHAAALQSVTDANAQAQQLRDSLKRTTDQVTQLETRVSDLQAEIATLTAENRRLNLTGEELTKSTGDANQTVETLRAELKNNAGRLAQLETANSKLRDDISTGRQSATQLSQLTAELQDVFRRREMYLNNILRRYKDITEQYRSLAGVLDSRRDREASPVSSVEIGRIQNTLGMAEEDMKQISALNAQASRLEKKLATR